VTTWEELAAHAGSAYLRYSFTKGTAQEVGFLVEALEISPGHRVLDVGCGPGRHAHGLTAAGARVVGVDLAEAFVREARAGGAGPVFVRGDARRLPVRAGAFDAVVCLCQGGFGLLGGGADESAALAQMADALRPGGRLALSAFSAYFAAMNMEEGESLDPASGVLTEHTTVRGPTGEERPFRLDSTCFTPRELRLMASAAGLEVDAVWSVGPGRYQRRAPTYELPEWLMVAHRPGATLKRR